MNNSDIDVFLEHLEEYRFIAHRLGFIMEGYPENSLNNLIALFNDQEALDACVGIEFDIQPTSDHVLLITHDFNMADISDSNVNVAKTSYDKIKKIKCGYRKSTYSSNIPWNSNNNFYLHTLDEILEYIDNHRDKLGDRIIKIESKAPIFKYEDLISLKKCLKRYPALSKNIVHISFFPWNLRGLRKSQIKDNLPITKTELLIDFQLEKPITIMWKSYIDGISLGLKEVKDNGNMSIDADAKRMADFNSFFYRHRNALTEKWLKKIIAIYGYAGIYTINDPRDVQELLSRVSKEFLEEYADKLVITSDNPKYFKNLSIKKDM